MKTLHVLPPIPVSDTTLKITALVAVLLFPFGGGGLVADARAAGAAAGVGEITGVAEKVLQIGGSRGICVVLGDLKGELALELARKSETIVYLQIPDAKAVDAARQRVEAEGFYGDHVYIEEGSLDQLHLADNLADAVVAFGDGARVPETEVLRAIYRPKAK